jgi:predicted AAA+ superfamily ATPase
VPEVLGAVKRAVDEDPRPGRFLVTGSSQADLTSPGWPATGRLIRLPLLGLVQRELVGATGGPSIIDLLASGEALDRTVHDNSPDLRGYVAAALRSGFPEPALTDSDRARSRWLSSYVDQLVTRDLSQVGHVRDPARLRRYLQAGAANTAGAVVHKTLFDAAGINRETATRFDTLLQQLFVVDLVPAYSSNRLNRLARLPKRYLIEPALMRPLLGIDERSAMRDGDILGRLIDSFVTAQLRAELPVSQLDPRLYHLRDTNGRHELDLVIELADGRVIGVEIKADAAPGPDAARHLFWLEEGLREKFAAGIVFHTGPRRIRYGPRIVGLPISTLWAQA